MTSQRRRGGSVQKRSEDDLICLICRNSLNFGNLGMVTCPHCKTALHDLCALSHFYTSRHCPNCRGLWEMDSLFGLHSDLSECFSKVKTTHYQELHPELAELMYEFCLLLERYLALYLKYNKDSDIFKQFSLQDAESLGQAIQKGRKQFDKFIGRNDSKMNSVASIYETYLEITLDTLMRFFQKNFTKLQVDLITATGFLNTLLLLDSDSRQAQSIFKQTLQKYGYRFQDIGKRQQAILDFLFRIAKRYIIIIRGQYNPQSAQRLLNASKNIMDQIPQLDLVEQLMEATFTCFVIKCYERNPSFRLPGTMMSNPRSQPVLRDMIRSVTKSIRQN